MLDWLKNIGKDFPEFWKNYLLQQENISSRKVVLHIETTGLNATKDRILSFGALEIVNNQVVIENCLEIDLSDKNDVKNKDLSYEEVQNIETLVNFIGNATIVGHRIHYDIEILNEYLSKMHCGRLKNNVFDVEVMHNKVIDKNSNQTSLTEIFNIYKIENPLILTSGNLAFSVALLFLKLRSRLKIA